MSTTRSKTNRGLSDRRYFCLLKIDPERYEALLQKQRDKYHSKTKLNEEYRERSKSNKRMWRLIRKERRLSQMLTQTQWAYLAGLIDGEGTIGISKVRQKKRGGIYINYRGYIRISNTDYSLIEKVQHWLNCGYITTNTRNGLSQNSKPIHAYVLEQLIFVEEALLNMVPYLHLKKRQAVTMLSWLQKKGWNTVEINEQHHQQMMTLNGYGRYKEPEQRV